MRVHPPTLIFYHCIVSFIHVNKYSLYVMLLLCCCLCLSNIDVMQVNSPGSHSRGDVAIRDQRFPWQELCSDHLWCQVDSWAFRPAHSITTVMLLSTVLVTEKASNMAINTINIVVCAYGLSISDAKSSGRAARGGGAVSGSIAGL